MNTRVFHILFAAGIASLACVVPAFGQDGSLPEYEVSDPERDRIERERIINSPGEGEVRYIPRTPISQPSTATATRDTATAKPATLPATRVKTDQLPKQPERSLAPREDESILSFNFLYYIIQKYKLQDIVD